MKNTNTNISMFAALCVAALTACGPAEDLGQTKTLGGEVKGGGGCNSGFCGNITPFINVTDEKCISGDSLVNLSWTNPIISPLPDKVLVLRKSNQIVNPPGGMGVNPGHPLDPFSDVIYFGSPTNFIQDLDVSNHTWYHYGIWWAYEVGTDSSGEPMYEYSSQGAFCQAYPCPAGTEQPDNPDPVGPVVVNPGDGAICLGWELPSDESVSAVRVYRSLLPFVGEAKDDPNATIVFEGSGTELVDSDLVNNQLYYYAIYTINEAGILSETAVAVSDSPTEVDPTPEEVRKLSASDGGLNDEMGHSVDIQGNLMLAGAFNANVNADNSLLSEAGKVYVFERTVNSPLTAEDDVWTEVQILTAGNEAREEARFGEEVYVSPDQDLIIVGAPSDRASNGQNSAGALYIFEKSPSSQNWVKTQKISPSQLSSFDDFGAEFDYVRRDSGEEILLAAAHDTHVGSYSDIGRVYVYERNGGSWTQTAVIESPAQQSDAEFGSEIDASGDQFAITGGNRVYIYEKVDNVWTIVQTIESDTTTGDFGHEVSVDGNIMAISMPGRNNGAVDNGLVYMYNKNAAGNWVEQQVLTPSVTKTDNNFGEDIDLSGNLLVVGTDMAGSGAIEVFRLTTSNVWTNLGLFNVSDAEAGDRAGEEVRISGNTLILGASEEDGGAGDPIAGQGAAYVFDITGLLNLCVAPEPAPIGGPGAGEVALAVQPSVTVDTGLENKGKPSSSEDENDGYK